LFEQQGALSCGESNGSDSPERLPGVSSSRRPSLTQSYKAPTSPVATRPLSTAIKNILQVS